MNLVEWGRFSSSFGLIQGPARMVAENFLEWQQSILQEWGFSLDMVERRGTIGEALCALNPRTAPIVTKYLFWPLDGNWTLYFDNGVNGSDAGPPSILSSRLNAHAIRVVMNDEAYDPVSGHVARYRATILECYTNGTERRHLFVVNDGGKWKFGQSGEPFPFENKDAYTAKSIKDRFTNAMLLEYVKNLGANLIDDNSPFAQNGPGYLLTKNGKLPAAYQEFWN